MPNTRNKADRATNAPPKDTCSNPTSPDTHPRKSGAHTSLSDTQVSLHGQQCTYTLKELTPITLRIAQLIQRRLHKG